MERDYIFKLGLTDGETYLLKDLLQREYIRTNSEASIYMMVCRLRKKLRRHDISISSIYGLGYKLTDDMKTKLAKYKESH